jgi:hypothetical protein
MKRGLWLLLDASLIERLEHLETIGTFGTTSLMQDMEVFHGTASLGSIFN